MNGLLWRQETDSLKCPLLAESGLSNLSFAAILVSALPAKADIQLILGERSANDPKRTLLICPKMLDLVNELEQSSICTTLKDNNDKAKPA